SDDREPDRGSRRLEAQMRVHERRRLDALVSVGRRKVAGLQPPGEWRQILRYQEAPDTLSCSASQLLAQHRLEVAAEKRRVVERADVRELRDLEPRITAGIDPVERLEIERDVDRNPMVGAVAPHAQADRGELLPPDVHARRVAAPR